MFWSIALAAIAMVLLTGATLEKFTAVEPAELGLAPKWATSYQRSERFIDIRISRKKRQYPEFLRVPAASATDQVEQADPVEQ